MLKVTVCLIMKKSFYEKVTLLWNVAQKVWTNLLHPSSGQKDDSFFRKVGKFLPHYIAS
jgi:hypothetical protein